MIDILCPVLGRAERTEPFVDSLAANTLNEYRLLFLCTPGDEEKILTCIDRGEIITVPWPSRKGDYAKKINHGFSQTEGEWVLCGADDLRFEHGWDREALACAEASGRLVVGTNDLHNPAVKKEILSTHPLLSRSYIDKYKSGTRDGTGVVFCELYDHQFVDTEFCEVAIERDEWIFCKQAIVEHLHPYWGLAPYDDTYTKALRKSSQDQRLFISRSRRATRTRRYR